MIQAPEYFVLKSFIALVPDEQVVDHVSPANLHLVVGPVRNDGAKIQGPENFPQRDYVFFRRFPCPVATGDGGREPSTLGFCGERSTTVLPTLAIGRASFMHTVSKNLTMGKLTLKGQTPWLSFQL